MVSLVNVTRVGCVILLVWGFVFLSLDPTLLESVNGIHYTFGQE
jgi:hypothetical protein